MRAIDEMIEKLEYFKTLPEGQGPQALALISNSPHPGGSTGLTEMIGYGHSALIAWALQVALAGLFNGDADKPMNPARHFPSGKN